MRLLRLLRPLLATVAFVAAASGASAADFQNGVDFSTLDTPVRPDTGKKVEVLEVFMYHCPHCNALDPALADWVKKQGDKIVFKQVPVAFRESFIPQQKMYYALEAMGLAGEMNPKIFRAIHVERQVVDTDATIMDFIGKQPGIDKKAFADLYNSFGTQTKVRRAAQLQESYKVDGVPMIAIGGHYLTSPSIAGATMSNQPETMQQAASLQVMDALVAKVAAEKGGKK